MRFRTFLSAVVAAGLALSSYALTAEHQEFGRGPAQFLMTKEEAAKWKTIKSDEEAEAFIALFWARRDPTPDTPRNEFREEFDARVDYADKNLRAGSRLKGSMTDRGKALILYGPPKDVTRSSSQRSVGTSGNEDLQANQDATGAFMQWIYEGDESVRELFGVPKATLRFIDRFGTEDWRVERGAIDLAAAQQRAVARAIRQPDLTVAPTFTAAAPAAAAVALTAPAAPAVQTELTTDSLKSAVAEFKAASKNPYGKQTFATYGEYVTGDGTYFVPVGLYVPKAAGISGDNLTFFGVLQDANGNNVQAFEVPATLTATRDDFFVDRTLLGVPAGKYRGYFGLAQNGTPVSMASAEMELAGTLDKDATAISQLILSNNLYPLSEAQKADDPFAFGGLKVIPKADRTFRKSDELWYFFELRNPGIADGATAPSVQVKIDVAGAKKLTAPPMAVDPIEIKGVPGRFGVGNAIPLTTFVAGDYTFTVKVMDTVKKTSYTLTDKFTVVE